MRKHYLPWYVLNIMFVFYEFDIVIMFKPELSSAGPSGTMMLAGNLRIAYVSGTFSSSKVSSLFAVLFKMVYCVL